MIFPKDSRALWSLVNLSPANILLGKRIPGPGGNEAEHKTFQRFAFRPVPWDKYAQSKALYRLLDVIERRAREKGLSQSIDWLADLRAEDLETDWKGVAAHPMLRRHTPQAARFIEALDRLSLDLAQSWQDGRRSDVLERIAALPWAGSATMSWFQDHLRSAGSPPDGITRTPAELQGLIVAYSAYSQDLAAGQPRVRSWRLSDLAASRHPDTGALAAIRFFLDRLLDATGQNSLNALYMQCLEGEDRIRQGKRYRAGEVPSLDRALQMVARAERLMPGGRMGQSATERRTLALCAVLFQNAFKQARTVAIPHPEFNPLWIFDVLDGVMRIPLETLWAAVNRPPPRCG